MSSAYLKLECSLDVLSFIWPPCPRASGEMRAGKGCSQMRPRGPHFELQREDILTPPGLKASRPFRAWTRWGGVLPLSPGVGEGAVFYRHQALSAWLGQLGGGHRKSKPGSGCGFLAPGCQLWASVHLHIVGGIFPGH